MLARRNPFASGQNEVVSAANMTGTPSEPTSDKLDDDLAETGAPRAETAEDSSASDRSLADSDSRDSGDNADAPARPRRKKKRSSAAPPATKPRPIARFLAIAVLLGIPIALVASSYLGNRGRGAGGGNKLPSSTGWASGSEQSIDVTLVPQDRTNLACASASEVAGHHCQFEAQNKPWAKTPIGDEKVQYKPYRLAGTNDPVLIAGLWSDPGMSRGPLPTERFTAKCKFKVEGKVDKLSVRWNPADPWYEEPFAWPSGTVSNCTITR